MLWRITEAVNEQLLDCDPTSSVSESDVREIQVEVLDRVFAVMSKNGRSQLSDEDLEFIRRRVRTLVRDCMPAPKLRFAKLDRVVCNVGGARGWAAGTVQSINEEDPGDPTGQSTLPCTGSWTVELALTLLLPLCT